MLHKGYMNLKNKNRTYRIRKTVLRTLLMMTVFVGISGISVSAAENIRKIDDGSGIATPSSVVEETALVMDSSAYVFSNSTDGMFRISFAEGKSYYLGSAEDSDTKITYALIKYGTKLYLVAADDSEDNVEYNGSYTDTTFDMLESKNYNSSIRKVKMSLKYGKNIELTHFTFNKDYSVKLSGYYNGTYYTDDKAATGIFERNGYCDYFVGAGGYRYIGKHWQRYSKVCTSVRGTCADCVSWGEVLQLHWNKENRGKEQKGTYQQYLCCLRQQGECAFRCCEEK